MIVWRVGLPARHGAQVRTQWSKAILLRGIFVTVHHAKAPADGFKPLALSGGCSRILGQDIGPRAQFPFIYMEWSIEKNDLYKTTA